MRRMVVLSLATSLLLLVACGGDKEATDPPAVAPDDRHVLSTISSIRICEATVSGVAGAARDLSEKAAAGDLPGVQGLGDTLSTQAGQLTSTSRDGSTSLQGATGSESTGALKEEALALFQRCTATGQQATGVADAAIAADAGGLEQVATDAESLANDADDLAADVTAFANELPKPTD